MPSSLKIQKARFELLEWEARNRTALNRAVDAEGHPSYKHQYFGGCAIGRLLSLELAERLPKDDTVEKDTVWPLLPSHVRKLGREFLESIQRLHDFEGCWGTDGLGRLGEGGSAWLDGLTAWRRLYADYCPSVPIPSDLEDRLRRLEERVS